MNNLEAPKYYWNLSEESKLFILQNHFLFDHFSLWKINSTIKEIFLIHGYMYQIGNTMEDKMIADHLLKLNANIYISDKIINIFYKYYFYIVFKNINLYGNYYFIFPKFTSNIKFYKNGTKDA